MNNKYKIKIEAPLLRPGITITTEVSERYVVPVLEKVMQLVREFNQGHPPVPATTEKIICPICDAGFYGPTVRTSDACPRCVNRIEVSRIGIRGC
jgi:hypothetical protein